MRNVEEREGLQIWERFTKESIAYYAVMGLETYRMKTSLISTDRTPEHAGNLNEAVNAHFSEGDRNITHETSVAAPQEDYMDIDEPTEVAPRRPPLSLLPSARNMNPFSLLDPIITRGILDSGTGITSQAPFVSHPREVREIPIEVKDGNELAGQSGLAPTVQDFTGIEHEHGPEIHGTVVIDDEEDEDLPGDPTARSSRQNGGNDGILGGNSRRQRSRPSAPEIDDLPDNNNDIEEEMIRAAIEASKWDADTGYSNQSGPMPQQRPSHLDDVELAHAVSLSLKTAEQEKAVRELGGEVGPSVTEAYKPTEVGDRGKSDWLNGRLEAGGSSIQDEAEDAEEQPLVRHRSRHMSSDSVDTAKEMGEIEWGGISSQEHDEAVMLEAALFGGIPEASGYRVPYAPHQFMQDGLDRTVGPNPWRMPRPPSPSLTAQRQIREQQDDEYLASLQADREKELKAREEAELRRLEEQAAREAELEEERQKEVASRRKLEEEQEIERQLAAKEASLPQEPSSDDENAVNLLVRMPDGSRRGRRFLRSHKLQCLFDFIDVGRVVKPGTYRLVRPYPRRAFSGGESALTLNELGLTSKQEALFLEFI
ncbi:hypothetical protein RJ639_042321 [Escallonia herrerae]|uniref:UBX domain-containing protein n=1 Tax=Escallonia herrerae TaxID=1293975 RepID=A0AA88WH41_9ASTE|nr:hypothetical protein RJ639_042321 [Escallonia herrerae]